MEVECPPGNPAGTVEQNIDVYRPTFDINDENGEVQYVIEGPSFCQSCWRDCCNFCCAKCCFLGNYTVMTRPFFTSCRGITISYPEILITKKLI